MSDTTGGLYKKLAEVMAEIGMVHKKGWNDFHSYHYVTEADLVDAVREKLAERHVVLIPSVSALDERGVTSDKGKQSTITTVHVDFTFCDGDTGETHTASWAGSGDDPADKGLYKAYTGAVKYFLMKSFLIPTGDDPEGDHKTDERSQNGQQRQPNGTPTDKQLALLKSLITKNKPGQPILRAMLDGIGRGDIAIEDGWLSKLTKGNCSALIDIFKNGVLPDPEAQDIPSQLEHYETPQPDSDAGDVPWSEQ